MTPWMFVLLKLFPTLRKAQRRLKKLCDKKRIRFVAWVQLPGRRPEKCYACYTLKSDNAQHETELSFVLLMIEADEIVGVADPSRSPMRLQLKFESFGGAKIDTDSLKVTYIKNPAVDLTPRLKPFVQPTGIDMPDAELPAGDHLIRVDVKDSDGRAATTSFTIKIAP